jgi:hypothetical protein
LLGIAISFYGQSWAQSGLIHGIAKQSGGEILSLYQMSNQGKLKAIEVVKIRLLPGLIFALTAVALALFLIIPGLLLGNAGKFILVFLSIVYAIGMVVASVMLGASVHLGILAINLESLTWKDGLKRGFAVFKKYFLDVFIMSTINCFAGCVFGLATLIVLGVLIGIGVASVFGVMAFPPFLIAAGPIIFLAFLALIMFMGAVGAISAVFNQSTWVLLYKQLTEEPHGQQ